MTFHDERWPDARTRQVAPLDQRIADRLADLRTMAEEISRMLLLAPDGIRREMDAAITRIYTEAGSLAMQLPPLREPSARDPEVGEVLAAIGRQLR